MLSVDRITLRVPAEWAQRAPALARLLVGELARAAPALAAAPDHVRASCGAVAAGLPDRAVAARIAEAVVRAGAALPGARRRP